MRRRDVSGQRRLLASASALGLAVAMVLGYVVASRVDLFAWFSSWADRHPGAHLGELAVVAAGGLLGAMAIAAWWSREAHRVAAELAQTNEQYRSLFAYHPHGVFSVGLDGRFTSANTAAEEISGWSEDELRRMEFLELLHPDSRDLAAQGFLELLGQKSQYLELTLNHRLGRLVQLSVTGLPIVVGKEVVGIYGIARDVTKHNGMMRELRRANLAAERAGEAKAAFLANISHEIRTPLTSLLTASELLGDTELDPLQREVVDTLDRAGRRLQRLVDNVLDFSKLEAGKVELEQVDLDIRDLAQDAVTMVAHVAGRKDVTIRHEVAAAVPRLLAGDPVRISQVLNNLLGNAVKFTAEGTVTLRVSLGDTDTDTDTDDDQVDLVFAVTDTGIGISPDQRGRLFHAFTQADPSITRRYGGTGLGLVISRNLVSLMGGSIWATSNLGHGSTFSFRVPLGRPSERPPVDTETPTDPGSVPG